MLEKYASLLVEYCLYLRSGEILYINTSTLAEPLVRELYKQALQRGVWVEVNFGFEGKNDLFYEYADDFLLNQVPEFEKNAMKKCDAYLYIRAPYKLKSSIAIDPMKRQKRAQAMKAISSIYYARTTDGSMRRSLCQYPTYANAEIANMDMEAYREFVFSSCKLDHINPAEAWKELSSEQQVIVDFLNGVQEMRYESGDTDISFGLAERTWINSDGKTNMPSGEVYTSPVEDSVNGHIYFDFPSIYMSKEIRGVRLEVKDGLVVKWSAEEGEKILNEIMEIEGARRFGEVAIGCNYDIKQATKNILFDEKIGGTIHMALGQSYGQTGGVNKSAIHWDMIKDMRHGGCIYADGERIYENGEFLKL